MDIKRFENLLEKIKSNDTDAIAEILTMYKPLIVSQSHINGKFDEDLYQHIVLHIIKKIAKFK